MDQSRQLTNNTNREYKSLLEKYDIPIGNISYEYISQCNKAKEIENIIRILRSGEEGYYPDLLKFAEHKLSTIKPGSTLLQFEKPVIKKDTLPREERQFLENDLEKWISEMKIREKDISDGKSYLTEAYNSLLPKIRNINELKQSSSKPTDTTKNKKISSCDYTAWDKYDADTELIRIDLQEQQKQAEIKRAQQERKDKENTFNQTKKKLSTTLTNSELGVMAETERSKGNEAFKTGDYKQALQFYNASIELNGNITAYNNRAMTHIKLKNFSNAYEDCCVVLNADPNNVKALLRRGTALENLLEKSKALKDFEAVVKIESNNNEALQAIKRLGGSLPGKSVRMKIVNENEDFEMPKSALIRLPFSYYKSLTYVDLFTNCNCLALPTSSYHIYPIPHPRNVHCKIGARVEAERQRKLKAAKISAKKENNTSEIKTDSLNKNHISTKKNINDNSNNYKVCLKNSLNENQKPINSNGKITSNNVPERIIKNEKGSKIIEVENKFIDQLKMNGITNNLNNNNSEENFENNNLDFSNLKIKSPYEFLCTWRALKKDSLFSQHAQFLRCLDPDKIDIVIGNNMDSDMWSTIIECLVNNFLEPKDKDLLQKYLNSFYKLDQFKIILMFMNSSDKEGLDKLFESLQKHGVNPNEVKAMRAKYELQF